MLRAVILRATPVHQSMGSSGERYQTQFYVLWQNEISELSEELPQTGQEFFPLISIFHFFFGSEKKKMVNKDSFELKHDN